MTHNPDDYRPATVEWSQFAACVGVGQLMFPDPSDSRGTHAAKRVCAVCPVRSECLNQAFEGGETWGVWGGFTPAERTALRRRVARNNLRVVNGADVVLLCLASLIAEAAGLDLDEIDELVAEGDAA